MKRFSLIFFIWSVSLLMTISLSLTCYLNGQLSELVAWLTTSIFLSNLITYHLFVTRNEKNKDPNLLDE
jgi:hypothetical protein